MTTQAHPIRPFHLSQLSSFTLQSAAAALHHARLQDLSYLQADRYATLVRHWLSTAHPLRSILQDSKQTLRDFCNTTQPPLPAATSPHQSSSDMYITYKDNSEFERLGRELSPMLADVSGGVSCVRVYWLVECELRARRVCWPLVSSTPSCVFISLLVVTTCCALVRPLRRCSWSSQAQIPRGVYNSTGHGLVIVRCRQRRLFLVQKDPAATPPR